MQPTALLSYTWDQFLLADANNNASFVLQTPSVAPTWASPKLCKHLSCAQFAAQSYFVVPAINLGKQTGLTFSVWYKPSSTVKTKLFEFSDGENRNNIYLGKSALQGLVAGVHRVDTDVDTIVTRDGGWTTGSWNHVVWLLRPDGQQSVWTIYVNGVVLYAKESCLYPANVDLSANYMGKGNWAGDIPFEGYLDSFYVFSKALTAAEASALYTVRSSRALLESVFLFLIC